MSKKSVAMIVVGVAVVFFILGASFFQSDNSNEVEKETDDLVKEREKTEQVTKDAIKDEHGIEDEILTKEEISDEITKYKRESDEDLEDEDIRDKIEEEHGKYNARAYEFGLMIDESMSEEDKKFVIAELIGNSVPIKKIVNSIDGEFGNKEENKIKKIGDLPRIELGESYYSDTEGFFEVDGVNVGYPVVSQFIDPEDEEDKPLVSIVMYLYTDKDIKESKVNNYLDKVRDLEVSGYKVGDKDIQMPDRIEDLKEDKEEKIHLGKDTLIYFGMVVPYDTVFKEDSDIENSQDLYEKFFSEDSIEGKEETPKVKVGDKEIDLDIEMDDEELEEKGFIIKPEVVGSK